MPKAVERKQGRAKNGVSEQGNGHFQDVDRQTHKNAKEIIKLIGEDLQGAKSLKIGYIYVVQEGSKGYVKIGFSAADDDSRSSDVEKCRYRIVDRRHTPRFFGAYRCEQIVHKLLSPYGYDYHKCSCPRTKKHREWYGIEVKTAVCIIELVRSWMLLCPYQSGGGLKPEWEHALEAFTASLETTSPETITEFFQKNDQPLGSSNCEWEIFHSQQTPSAWSTPNFHYDLLGELSPRSISSDPSLAESAKSERSFAYDDSAARAMRSHSVRELPLSHGDDSPFPSPLSTPSKLPVHRHPSRSAEGRKTSSGSKLARTPEEKERDHPRAIRPTTSADRYHRVAETPSKPRSRVIVEKNRVESDSDEEEEDDDDDEQDKEQEEREDDIDVNRNWDSPLRPEEVNYLREMNLIERFSQVRIGEKPSVHTQPPKLTSDARGDKGSNLKNRASASTSLDYEPGDTEIQSVAAGVKAPRFFPPGSGAARGLGKGLPAFHVHPVEDSVGESTGGSVIKAHRGDEHKELLKKPAAEHRRGGSLRIRDVVPLATTELSVRPSSAAGIRITDGFDAAAQMSKAGESDIKINLAVHIRVKNLFFK